MSQWQFSAYQSCTKQEWKCSENWLIYRALQLCLQNQGGRKVWKSGEGASYNLVSKTLFVFRALKYAKNSFQHSTTFFMSTWWGDCKNVQNFFSRWLFEIIHFIHFEMHIFGIINYLSIWSFNILDFPLERPQN